MIEVALCGTASWIIKIRIGTHSLGIKLKLLDRIVPDEIQSTLLTIRKRLHPLGPFAHQVEGVIHRIQDPIITEEVTVEVYELSPEVASRRLVNVGPVSRKRSSAASALRLASYVPALHIVSPR